MLAWIFSSLVYRALVWQSSQVNQPPGEVQITMNKGRSQPQLDVKVVPGFLSRLGSSSAEPYAALQTQRESLSDLQSTIIKHISKDKYITLGHGHTPKHRHITTAKTPALTYTLLNMQSFLKYKQDLQLNKRKMWGWGKEFSLFFFFLIPRELEFFFLIPR